MGQHLALTVRLHEPRYHGLDEWPPAPARLFQALVAGASRNEPIERERAWKALRWLEELPAPLIAAPAMRRGDSVIAFVPNNDADSVDGDPDRIPEIRTKKLIAPRLLQDDAFLYVWPLADASRAADAIEVANGLYQFGRGVDLAWAVGELLDDGALEARLQKHAGSIHRPRAGDGGAVLQCPTSGTLTSLDLRFEAMRRRLRPSEDGMLVFAQPPKARFAPVRYEGETHRQLYELRAIDADRAVAWPFTSPSKLVEIIRDGAAARLRTNLAPALASAVERTVVGRRTDGVDDTPAELRLRIVPLASIGHEHADHAFRRLLVEIPSGGALSVGDLQWAFSGFAPHNASTGELGSFALTPAPTDELLRRYMASARSWCSVTPVVLPIAAARRRIEPARKREEAKSAGERLQEHRRATMAVATALRHAGVKARLEEVRVQREPFDRKGARAERFAEGTRFAKERLWHVLLRFDRDITGPLVIGDGRFLGLGLMAPMQEERGLFAFSIEDRDVHELDAEAVAIALRRAVMAKVQKLLPRQDLPMFFSGHAPGGGPAADDSAAHLAFQLDASRRRLVVIAPHLLDRRRTFERDSRYLGVLEKALNEIAFLQTRTVGRLRVRLVRVNQATDPLLGPARWWNTATPYLVTRHHRETFATDSIARDVRSECVRNQLPVPDVIVDFFEAIPGSGLRATIRLHFRRAIRGPLVLGRSRFRGGGLFVPAEDAS